uniref:Uncharacterized protein n=1 Tax=Fagus sylvatica TaxID=28930 RepID=A0A2N9HYS2_FAGSY
MTPKKSVGEVPRKRLKSRAQRDVSPTMDNTFRFFEHSVKLDLAFYIGWHMDACVKKKNDALPYGLHITTILNHFRVNYELKDNTWVKKDAPVVDEIDEEAQMDEAEAQGNEGAIHEDDEPPTASPSSSHVNEDNFQLVFGLLDSLASSMGNLTTSMKNLGTLATNMDNFSTMVTQRLSTYDENFARLAQIMEDINERLKQDGIWLLVSHLCFDDAKGEKDMLFFVILYLDVI